MRKCRVLDAAGFLYRDERYRIDHVVTLELVVKQGKDPNPMPKIDEDYFVTYETIVGQMEHVLGVSTRATKITKGRYVPSGVAGIPSILSNHEN